MTKDQVTIVLSRQKLNYISKYPDKNNRCLRGAYEVNITSHDNKVTIIASGSEVDLALATQELLKLGVDSKVVSMPCKNYLINKTMNIKIKF